ncbi:MAG: methyltransferase family protein [Flavobacteriales bacterium]
MYLLEFTSLVQGTSFALIGLGVAVRAWVIAQKAAHTSGRNRHEQVAHSLNTKGMYSMTQHPLYVGSFLIWIGVCIRFNNLLFILGVFFFSILMLALIIKTETAFLNKTFGETYKRWRSNTPALYINPFKFKPSENPFNSIRVFATEYPTWVSVATGLLMVDILRFMKTDWSDAWWWQLATWCGLALVIGLGGRFFKYVVVRRWLKYSI